MVFKKYIKRGGRIYGPYLYHNVRKKGRVITTYHGKSDGRKEKFNKLFFAIIFLSVLIIALSANLFFLLKLSFTGKVSADIKDIYNDGENIEGDLELVLQHGEFFPAESTVVIDNAGEISEYVLENLILQESFTGNFYVTGFDLKDIGNGYGVVGQKEIYPEVTFSFRVVEGEKESFSEEEKVVASENETQEVNESVLSEEGTDESSGEENVNEEIPSLSIEELPIISDSIGESPIEDSVSDSTSSSDSSILPDSETSSVESSDDVSPEVESSIDSESNSLGDSAGDSTSSDASTSSDSGNSITGEIVGEDENLIVGKVKFGEEFIYNLEENQKIEIVYTTAPVEVDYKDSRAVVTTYYSEIAEGFGEDYLTDETISIPLSFSDLNLKAKEGILKISFVYSGVELISTEKEITVLENVSLENITEPLLINETNFTREQEIDFLFGGKTFKFDEKIKEKLLRENSVRVILKLKSGESSRGEKLGRLDYEVVNLDLLTLQSLGDEVEEIVVDEPLELFLEDSEKIIRSTNVKDEFGLSGAGIKICVIDSGVDSNVINYVDGWDFVDGDGISDDMHGHGTQVANVIKTISPNAELYVAKVIDANGVGYESDVLEGIDWCMNQGVDIISFSIGAGSYSGYCDLNYISEVSNNAVDDGIFVVAATGNDGSTALRSPSCANGVFRVSSTTKTDSISSFSNVNEIVDVFAPGENILTKTIGGSEISASGTSMSAPIVSASAALILENESLNVEELKHRFRTTGIPISYDNIFIPRIDTYNAVINNFTFDPGNYTANETNETNGSLVYDPLTQTYRITLPPSTVSACGSFGCLSCVSIANNFNINEKDIAYGEARFNVTRLSGFDGSVHIMVCDSNSQNCTLSSGMSPSFGAWITSSYYNMSVSPNYTISNLHGSSYDVYLCANRASTGSSTQFNFSWVDLHVVGLNCSDNLDSSQLACGACGGTWITNGNGGGYGSCCGDDGNLDTWGNSTLACCGGSVYGATQNQFCSINNKWVDQGEGFCNTTDMGEIYFEGLDTANSELICGDCIFSATNQNYLCDNSPYNGVVDGICGITPGVGSGFACIGFGANVSEYYFGTYNVSQGIPLLTSCDPLIDSSGFITAGVTALNSSTETCATSSVCQDDSNFYYNSCSLCDINYGVDQNGDSCDSSVSDGSYIEEGMCVRFGSTQSICLPSSLGEEVVINSAGEFFVDILASNTCNSTTLSGGEWCDSVSGTNFQGDGVCASNTTLRTCSTGLVCNSSSVFYNNCSVCGANTQCDSDVWTNGFGYVSNGLCAETDGDFACCTTGAGSCVVNPSTNFCAANNSATCSNYVGTDYCSQQFCTDGSFGSDVSCNGAICSGGSCTTICSPFCGGDVACVGYDQNTCSPENSSVYCSSSCQALDRDSSEAYCTSSATSCIVYNWTNVNSPSGYAPCCGDDGVDDDWDRNSNYFGTATNACYNGNLFANGQISGSLYNYNGDFYDCGNNITDAQNVETTVANCGHYGNYYCDASTKTWILTAPSSCTCSAGTDCASGLCVEQRCQTSCEGNVTSVNRCSNTSASYTSYGICTLLNTSTQNFAICDNFGASRTSFPITYLFDCSSLRGDYGYSCDSNSLSGGYILGGVCGGTNHATCYTDYSASNISSITSTSVFGTEAQVCSNATRNGWYCDSVSDGDFFGLVFGGNPRCDFNDSYCDFCSDFTPKKGEDGMCEVVCGASLACDELGSSSCVSGGYCNSSCGFESDPDTSAGFCNCNLGATSCNGASCFNTTWVFESSSGSCCGDDLGEENSSSVYESVTYYGCCDDTTDCVGPVDGGGTQCYSNGTLLNYSICEYGEWTFAPAPVVESLVLAPKISYTKDDLNCIVNVTDADTTNLNLTIAWYKNSNNIFNDSFDGYSQGTLFVSNFSHDYTHHGDDVSCGVFVTDGISNIYNSSDSVDIRNYSTSVGVSNEEDTSMGVTEHFGATYTSTIFGEIGEDLWTSPYFGDEVYAVAYYDCNGIGKKNCFVYGGDNFANPDLIFYNYTGEIISSSNTNNDEVRDIKIYDFDSDGFDEVVVAKVGSSTSGILFFDSDGTELWNSGASVEDVLYLALGDVNSDGNVDIVGGQMGTSLFVYNFTGTQLFSYSAGGTGAFRGISVGNFSNNGRILFAKFGGIYGVLNSTGGVVWSLSEPAGDVNTINLDGDSYDEVLVGRYLRAYDDDGTSLWSIGAFNDTLNYELEVADIDNDGTEEFVYGDGKYVLAYNATTSSYHQEWNFSVSTNFLYYSVMSLILEDLNDDNLKEIIFGGIDDIVFVLNSSGKSKYNFSVYGDVGFIDYNPSGGRHSAIDVGDFNGDGVGDVLVGSADNHAYIFQTADCNIAFNDSVFGEMVWDSTNSEWDYSRDFDAPGNYTYNVTCFKGGYQTSVDYGSIFVNPNTAPNTTFIELNSSSGTNTSAENLNCYASVFDPEEANIYINYTWYNGTTLFSSGQAGSFNSGVVNLVSTLPSANTNHFENWTCSVKGYDGAVYESDWNNASLFVINSLPVASNLVLNSTSGNNVTSDNLTIHSILSDIDLDNVFSVHDWRIDDASFAVLNLPFNTNVNVLGGILKDYTTYENNATLGRGTFGTAPTWTSNGKIGGAYVFDGSNDAIVVKDSASLNISGNLTVSAWVYAEEYAAMRIISKHGPTIGEYGWMFSTASDGRLNFRVSPDGTTWDGADSVTTLSSTFSIDAWHHTVAMYDGVALRIYIDGVHSRSVSYNQGINVASGPAVIGADSFFSSSFFDGTIDDVMIFDEALSDAQIRELYLSGVANHSLEKVVSQETEIGQNWTVAITPSDSFVDGQTVTSNWLLIQNTPPIVTLLAPANDSSITNRTPTFTWSGFDEEGDPLTYEINISLVGASTCSDLDRDFWGLTDEYYTVATQLNCLYDNNDYYIWTVRASDDSGNTWGEWAAPWIIKIQALVSINVTNDLVNFGTVLPEDVNDTEDNNPQPLTLENIGNVRVNVSVNATDLWNSVLNPTNYFQYKIDNSTELGSFDWFLSQTSWAQVPSANSPQTAIVLFDWLDSHDDVQVDLNISVPPNEGAGTRTSTIQFAASLAE